jgi:hypothetical protein
VFALLLIDNIQQGKGAFPLSHFFNKLAGKLNHKVASVSLQQTNLVCYKLLTDKHVKKCATFVCESALCVSLSASLLQKCDGGNAPYQKDSI